AGSPEGGGSRSVRMKRVNDVRLEFGDLRLHRGLRYHRQVPHPELEPALAESACNALDGDRVAAHGRKRERRHQRNAGRHDRVAYLLVDRGRNRVTVVRRRKPAGKTCPRAAFVLRWPWSGLDDEGVNGPVLG